MQKLVNAGCKQTFAAGRPKVRYAGQTCRLHEIFL